MILKPSPKRVGELSRSIGTSMVSAAFIAYAIRPAGFTFAGAILLIITGISLWYAGTVYEANQEDEE